MVRCMAIILAVLAVPPPSERLAGLDLEQRARALVDVAAPQARRELGEAFERMARGREPREG